MGAYQVVGIQEDLADRSIWKGGGTPFVDVNISVTPNIHTPRLHRAQPHGTHVLPLARLAGSCSRHLALATVNDPDNKICTVTSFQRLAEIPEIALDRSRGCLDLGYII